MSRSGYQDDLDQRDVGRWRGAVRSSIHGKRGQKLLRDLRDALDAMPAKSLIAGELVTADGEVCALGCLALARGLDVSELDPEEPDRVADVFDIAPALAAEIAFENDECGWDENTEQRWLRLRRWVERNIRQPA